MQEPWAGLSPDFLSEHGGTGGLDGRNTYVEEITPSGWARKERPHKLHGRIHPAACASMRP
jgi:hypothetical protein